MLFVAFITPGAAGAAAGAAHERQRAAELPGARWASASPRSSASILRERRAATPLLPIHLLRQATIWRSDALAACHGATLVSLITFIPIYLRVLRGTSASETGLLLLPLMFGIGAGSMVDGARRQPHRPHRHLSRPSG